MNGRAPVAWLVGVLLVASLLTGVARFASTSEDWLPYPYPRAGSEGLILYESLLMKRGGDIYEPITPQRFISGPYPPVYYALAAALLPGTMPGFGEPASVRSVFTPGRIVSLAAALVAAAGVALLAVLEMGRVSIRDRRSWPAVLGGLAGGAAFLTLPQTAVWATRFRGDMLMVAFTALGLVCVAAGSRRPRGEGEPARGARASSLALYLLAPLFFSLAFYTKQTAIAGPAASALYLLLLDRRAALRWSAVMAAAVGLPFLALEVATGHWFFLKMVDYHSLPLRESTLTRLLQSAFLEDSWPIMLAGLGYALYRLGRWLRNRQAADGEAPVGPGLVPIFLLVALAMLPTGAVVGADHNHLLVPGLALAAAVGAGCAWLLRRIATDGAPLRGVQAGLAVLLIAALPHFGLVTSPPSAWYDADLTVPPAEVQEQLRKIVHNVSANPASLFFSDDPGIVALAGKETPYDDPFTMTALALQGRWDESAYRAMLAEGQFGLLVLSCNVIEAPEACRHDTLSPGVRDALSRGYRVLFRDVLTTYAPIR